LDYVGIAAAVAAHCHDLAEQHKVNIGLHSKNIPPDVSREVSLCLFRILQEALQNAIKHSGSRDFQVFLNGRNREIELVVRDAGVGFNPAQAFKSRGMGLRSMTERLKLVNGRISIESESGRGTTIHARAPVSP
jgi:signal transduction histidine kinase